MGQVPVIVLGDQTTGGGKVIEGSGETTVEGKPVARYGDKVTCPLKGHGGVVTILEGDPTHLIDGKPAAYHNALLSCGCRVLASQSLYFVQKAGGRGSAAETAVSTAQAAPETHEFNDFYILSDPTGKPLPNCAYAVEFPNGLVEYGTTDGSGKTKVHGTQYAAEELIFYRQGA